MTVFGMISTYPPTQCGLASFTDGLRTGLLADEADEVRIVRVGELPRSGEPAEVVAWFVDVRTDTEPAAAALNECDVAVIQHDFGIYSGEDGQDVLRVADMLRVPTIAVLHSVPATPSPHQREVLEELIDRVNAIVVMSDAAADRLLSGYAVDAAKIAVIPHGAHVPRTAHAASSYADGDGGQPAVLLTCGLIGPGKGIEWGIEALATVRAAGIDARYVVAGQTHPKVHEASGESYRSALLDRARDLGVEDAVEFDDSVRSAAEQAALVSTADVVLLPYDSTEKVTSGALVQALASGRPVVASAFPHAEELLAAGAGVTVRHRDPLALAAAVQQILTEPGTAASMTSAARGLAAGFDWATVSDGYRRLAALLRAEYAQLLV